MTELAHVSDPSGPILPDHHSADIEKTHLNKKWIFIYMIIMCRV